MAGLNPHAAIFEPTVTAGGGGGVYAPSMAGGAVKTRAAYGSVLIENIKEGGVYQPHRGRCHLCDAEFNSLRQEQDHISGTLGCVDWSPRKQNADASKADGG